MVASLPAPTPPARAELQQHPQWLCWRAELREDKRGKKRLTKVPYTPQNGRKASSTDPTSWGSYEQASLAYDRSQQTKRPYGGLGYVFAGDVTGVDLDHCILPDGSIDAWAQRILEVLASYAEFSPNDGIHVCLRGEVKAGNRRRVNGGKHEEAALELYSQGRYFTMTGRQVPGTSDQLAAVPAEDLLPLLQALVATNGEKVRTLWQGDTTGYLSASEADQALCNLLAFWTGHDPARVDALFRQSGLYRPEKWDRAARAGETYGAGTVARACNQLHEARSTPRQETGTPRATGRGSGVVIPFPIREVEESALPERDQHPLPETPIDQVLDCLRREEAGDAQLFTHLFRGRYVYDHTGKEWYAWQGHAWKRDATNQVINMVSGPLAAVYLETSAELSEQAANEARALPPKATSPTEEEDEASARARKHLSWLKATTAALIERARALRNRHRIQNVLALASAQGPLSITSDQWDTNPWLLATPDGVLDLQTGQLHPGRPEDCIRTVIPTRWQGIKTPAPRFERFWQEIFGDRPDGERADLIAFMQRTLGYGITGLVNEHVFLMLYGPGGGRNGKDTLMETLQYVLGPVSGAVSNDVVIAGGRVASAGSATPHLVDLQGKRIAWASEPQQGARFDVGQVKYLTGGGAISARQLHGRQYSFAPSHLLLLLTNHKPHADAGDSAFWHRLCPVLFNLTFIDHPTQSHERKRDTGLLQALKAEASGILAWLVRGCLEWQRRGLDIPECVLQARREYQGEEDTLEAFLQECCITAPQAKARHGQLYARYKEWTSENNLRALNGRTFGQEIKKRFVGGHDRRGAFYQGLGILATDETGVFDASENGECDGTQRQSNQAPQSIQGTLQACSTPLQLQRCDGSDGKNKLFSKWDSAPSYRENLQVASLPSHCGDTTPTQPALEALGTETTARIDPSHFRHTQAGDCPLPRERSYIRTTSGIVGYLNGNDRGQRQGVQSLFNGHESHWPAYCLQPLTWEEVRAWWLQRAQQESESGQRERFSV